MTMHRARAPPPPQVTVTRDPSFSSRSTALRALTLHLSLRARPAPASQRRETRSRLSFSPDSGASIPARSAHTASSRGLFQSLRSQPAPSQTRAPRAERDRARLTSPVRAVHPAFTPLRTAHPRAILAAHRALPAAGCSHRHRARLLQAKLFTPPGQVLRRWRLPNHLSNRGIAVGHASSRRRAQAHAFHGSSRPQPDAHPTPFTPACHAVTTSGPRC